MISFIAASRSGRIALLHSTSPSCGTFWVRIQRAIQALSGTSAPLDPGLRLNSPNRRFTSSCVSTVSYELRKPFAVLLRTRTERVGSCAFITAVRAGAFTPPTSRYAAGCAGAGRNTRSDVAIS